MRNNGVYKSDISTARWIAYDLPGNVGWILYFAGLILSFVNFPEYSRDIVMVIILAVSAIPALLMLIGIAELISERIHKLDRVLTRTRLLRGFGALTLGGILGTAISAVMLIWAILSGSGEMLFILIMLSGGILCGLFAGLLYKRYVPVEE